MVNRGTAADLREITKYTVKTWGEARCRTYIAAQEKSAQAEANGKGIFKDMSWLIPGSAHGHEWQTLHLLHATSGQARADPRHFA